MLFRIGKIAFIFAFIGSAMVTGLGWFFLSKASPLNHGVSPDVVSHPPVYLWVIANFPAGIAFISLFGMQGPEWTYFLCVFVQWFVIAGMVGLAFGALGSVKSRPESNQDINQERPIR
ncbi:MAG: hypothetical protein JWR69_4452 [Pedosphaera sp.]|nr:hypothetical protein [Pedosphaera sp.]